MKTLNLLKPSKVEVDIDSLGICLMEFENNIAKYRDVTLSLIEQNNDVLCEIYAKTSLISHIYLHYPISFEENSLVFGDSIERGYGDMIWDKVNPNRQMFWYVFLHELDKDVLNAIGVKVQPNTIVAFKVTNNEIVVDINTLSGGSGVDLNGRTLNACTLVKNAYPNADVHNDMRSFLKTLMEPVQMKTTPQPVYGFNNWYYAYGESSYEDIVSDTDLLLEVSEGLENRPFMVIDDGWSINPCGGPSLANDKFKDMEKLAKAIKAKGARPGIWFRPLKDESHHLDIPRHPLREVVLDPTCEETIALIKEDFSKLTKWGYELIKFDFVTVDIYLNYGFEMPDNLVSSKWRYKHNNLTNAEIILKMYRTIREVTPNVVLIGCNAITHLCAGIVEINRIGDDISGMEWERTRKYGVNSLAYRLVQNDIFYKIDADCVGIMGKYSWEQNRLWLDLLAKSGSPLFVSCDPKVADQKVKQDIKDAFIINCKQDNICYPIDYKQNLLPTKWIIDGEVVEYDWHLIP